MPGVREEESDARDRIRILGKRSRESRPTLLLTLAVFRVAVNEGALRSPYEVALVWQAASRWARTPAGKLAWLRKHSPRVLRPELGLPVVGNSAWSSRLQPSCDRPATLDVPDDWWDAARRPPCLAAYEAALALASGRLTASPCEVAPDTWGGELDRLGARRRGLVPIRCRGTLNTGYRYAGRALRAAVASGQ